MVLLQRAWAEGVAADDRAYLGIAFHGDDPRAESQRRAGETRSARLASQVEDRDGVGQGTGDRLVDEYRLAGLEDRPRLLEVRAAVDALQQHHVDPLEELVDRPDDLDAVLLAQVLGEARDPVAAGGDVRTAARIGRHDPHAGQLGLRFRGVQEPGERGDVRGIQADDPGPDRRRRLRLVGRCGLHPQYKPREQAHDANFEHAAHHGKTPQSLQQPPNPDGTSSTFGAMVATPCPPMSTEIGPASGLFEGLSRP